MPIRRKSAKRRVAPKVSKPMKAVTPVKAVTAVTPVAAVPAVTSTPAKPTTPAAKTSLPFDHAPSWFKWMLAEIGVKEVPGGRKANNRILEYRKIAKTPVRGDDGAIPWCAVATNAALEANGVPGSKSLMARTYEHHPGFIKLSEPILGCIVTKWRISVRSGKGHVGFYRGTSADGKWVYFLGGNQGDKISIAPFPRSSVVGYYWPKGVPIPEELKKLGKIVIASSGNVKVETQV